MHEQRNIDLAPVHRDVRDAARDSGNVETFIEMEMRPSPTSSIRNYAGTITLKSPKLMQASRKTENILKQQNIGPLKILHPLPPQKSKSSLHLLTILKLHLLQFLPTAHKN